MQDTDAHLIRETVLGKLLGDPERYLSEYAARFGNVLNADDAATLFDEYNADRARYRVAVHPSATWIRDELFRRAPLELAPEGRNRIVFTAGGNAVGKSTAISFAGSRTRAQCVFDSTFSNPVHAQELIDRALIAEKRITILHVNRPLDDALVAMLGRAKDEGRLVTIDQMIHSHRGAAETVRCLWNTFGDDFRFEFTFVENSSTGGIGEGTVENLARKDYTGIRELLDEILNAERTSGRLDEASYRQVRRR
jgi:hypothetical protein